MKVIGIVFAISLGMGSLSLQSSRKQFVPSQAGQNAAVSGAISVEGFVYTSGIRADSKGDITQQTNQIFQKIGALLRQAGSSLDNVAAVNVMLKNASDISAFDQAYRNQFKGGLLPARTMYLSRNMAQPGALVEIQMTAVANGGSRKAVIPPGWMKPDGPYSYGILSGDTLFGSAIEPRNYKDFAGAVPNLEVWPSVQHDIPSQVKSTMANANEVLKAAGMSFNDAVISRIAVRDGSDSVNEPMDTTYRALSGPRGATRMRYRGGLLGPYEFQVTLVAIKGSPREVLIAPNPDGSPGREDPNARFASGLKVGNRLFLSGTTAVTADNATDIKGQTHELLMNRLGPLLRNAGFDFKDVVQTEVELTDMSVLSGVDAVFRTLFPNSPPVRHIWGVNALNNKSALIEIGLMAVK